MSSLDVWQVGTLVHHPKMKEWGPGKVVKIDAERVHVVWRDVPDREAKVMLRSAVERAPDQHDEVLENLPPLVEKDGRLSLPTRRITLAQAVAAFHSRYPRGFYDPDYIGDMKHGERHYKWKAHEYYVQSLGGGQFRTLLENDLTTLVQEVERCVGKVNLLYLTEAAAFRDALRDERAARTFLRALCDVLDADPTSEKVFAPYARAVCDLPALKEVGWRRGQWPPSFPFSHTPSAICSSNQM